MEVFQAEGARIWAEYFWPVVGSLVLLGTAAMGVYGLREHRLRKAIEGDARRRLTELSQLNRIATVSELSVAIAHELNQPLGSILNNIEAADLILQSSPHDLPELREIIDDIRRDNQRAYEIIRRLRAMVAGKRGEIDVFDLNEAVGGAVHFCSATTTQKRISVHLNLMKRQFPVYGDVIQLQQVIINLIINCVDAIEASNGLARDIVVSTTASSPGNVKFSISDSGDGIHAGKLQDVFEPFYTTKPGGMGIGLALSRKIIEQIGGRMWAENGATSGAIFHFQLPMH